MPRYYVLLYRRSDQSLIEFITSSEEIVRILELSTFANDYVQIIYNLRINYFNDPRASWNARGQYGEDNRIEFILLDAMKIPSKPHYTRIPNFRDLTYEYNFRSLTVNRYAYEYNLQQLLKILDAKLVQLANQKGVEFTKKFRELYPNILQQRSSVRNDFLIIEEASGRKKT